jgi:hypothetical protein
VSTRTVNLTVEVHLETPINHHHDIIYRIYADGDLLVERSWIWGVNTLLKEHICIDISTDTAHTINLESILSIPRNPKKLSELTLQKLQTTDGEINIVDSNPQSVTFRIV